jgi:hypothetical protein
MKLPSSKIPDSNNGTATIDSIKPELKKISDFTSDTQQRTYNTTLTAIHSAEGFETCQIPRCHMLNQQRYKN